MYKRQVSVDFTDVLHTFTCYDFVHWVALSFLGERQSSLLVKLHVVREKQASGTIGGVLTVPQQ